MASGGSSFDYQRAYPPTLAWLPPSALSRRLRLPDEAPVTLPVWNELGRLGDAEDRRPQVPDSFRTGSQTSLVAASLHCWRSMKGEVRGAVSPHARWTITRPVGGRSRAWVALGNATRQGMGPRRVVASPSPV